MNLARLTGKSAMLPNAFYACCQLGIDVILAGAKGPTGAVARLSEDDVKRCIIGHTRLLRLSTGLVVALANPSCAAACESPEDCSIHLRILAEMTAAWAARVLTTEALAGLKRCLGVLTTLGCWTELCGPCRDGLVQIYLRAR